MSRMSEHAAEQDNSTSPEINSPSLIASYRQAYAEYQRVLDLWPPAHRTLEQQKAIYHAEGVCGIKKMKAGVI